MQNEQSELKSGLTRPTNLSQMEKPDYNIDNMLNLTSPVRQWEHEMDLEAGQRFKRNSQGAKFIIATGSSHEERLSDGIQLPPTPGSSGFKFQQKGVFAKKQQQQIQQAAQKRTKTATLITENSDGKPPTSPQVPPTKINKGQAVSSLTQQPFNQIQNDVSNQRRLTAPHYLDKAPISPTTFDTSVAKHTTPTKNHTAFGLNRKILNPYIIFQKNQTTVIDGTQPLFSVINKKLGGRASVASSQDGGIAYQMPGQSDVINMAQDKGTKKGNFFSSTPMKESSRLAMLNSSQKKIQPLYPKQININKTEGQRQENSILSPQEYLQLPLDTSFEDSAFFNMRKESKSCVQNPPNQVIATFSNAMPDLMTPKIQLNNNVKMYSSAENEGNGEIHPNALMPGRPFTTSLNMINVHGVSRKLSRIVNFGALQKKGQYQSKLPSGTQSPELPKTTKFLLNKGKQSKTPFKPPVADQDLSLIVDEQTPQILIASPQNAFMLEQGWQQEPKPFPRNNQKQLSESQSMDQFKLPKVPPINLFSNQMMRNSQIRNAIYNSHAQIPSYPQIQDSDRGGNTLNNSRLGLRTSQMKSRDSMRKVLSMSKVELSPDKQGTVRTLASSSVQIPSFNPPPNKDEKSDLKTQQPIGSQSLLSRMQSNLKQQQQRQTFQAAMRQNGFTPKAIMGKLENSSGNPRQISYLPKTGIDQVYMKHDFRFIRPKHPDQGGHALPLEPIHTYESQGEKLMFIDQYKSKETRKENLNWNPRIVYDCQEISPFYQGGADEYIRKEDLINQLVSKQPVQQPQGNKPQNDYQDPFGQEKIKLVQQNMKSPFQNNMNKYYHQLKPYYKLVQDPSHSDDTLIFESRFESGNLKRAIQIGRHTYDLTMKPDFACQTNTQWYYFRVQNTRKDVKYTFHITNFIKPDSLYSVGMKPLIYSKKEADSHGIGWHRAGEDIVYYPTPAKQKQLDERAYQNGPAPPNRDNNNVGDGQTLLSAKDQQLYTLSFKVSFKHDNDDVYFAYSFPYTYSEVLRYLDRISNYSNREILRRAPLCQTLAGNDIDMLIVTNFTSRPEAIAERPAVILTARVHPGESNSSFIMEGVIDFLLSGDEGAKLLRNRYVFKIVPMLNPDGVVIGNYRCSLSGGDLNRQWIAPNMRHYPEIMAVKQMVRKTVESRELAFYCDFHGHSRAKNAFVYGCNNALSKEKKNRERIFPYMLSKRCEEFSFEGCSFSVQKAKESTARVVLWKEYNLINSFTLECSFCGPNKGIHKDSHFTIPLLLDIGKKFCQTLVEYSDLEFSDEFHKRARVYIREIEDYYRGGSDDKDNQDDDGAGEDETTPKNLKPSFADNTTPPGESQKPGTAAVVRKSDNSPLKDDLQLLCSDTKRPMVIVPSFKARVTLKTQQSLQGSRLSTQQNGVRTSMKDLQMTPNGAAPANGSGSSSSQNGGGNGSFVKTNKGSQPGMVKKNKKQSAILPIQPSVYIQGAMKQQLPQQHQQVQHSRSALS